MESHEAIKRAYKKTPPKKVAADLNLSESMVRKWSQAKRGSGIPNPADRFVRFVKSTGDLGLVHWVCEQFGGYFVPNPKVNPAAPADLMAATCELFENYACIEAVVARAMKDKKVSPEEAEDISRCWEQIKSHSEAYVHLCRVNGAPPPAATARTLPSGQRNGSNPTPPRAA